MLHLCFLQIQFEQCFLIYYYIKQTEELRYYFHVPVVPNVAICATSGSASEPRMVIYLHLSLVSGGTYLCKCF